MHQRVKHVVNNACFILVQTFQIEEVWIQGNYDPETGTDGSPVSGLGAACLSVVNSQVRRYELPTKIDGIFSYIHAGCTMPGVAAKYAESLAVGWHAPHMAAECTVRTLAAHFQSLCYEYLYWICVFTL